MGGIALALALWSLGWAFGVPAARRWMVLLALWVVGVVTHLVLADGHGLRALFGGELRVWVVLGAIIAAIAGYGMILSRLRARAQPATLAEPAPTGPFQSGELDRYARHIMLREIGGPGQQRLKAAKVLVVGAGGLGSPLLLYLTAAGVGEITVIDPDQVDMSNLQRQIIHAEDRLGMDKAASAVMSMRALNSHARLNAVVDRLEAPRAEALIAAHDLVLDGTDNFDTRYLVNRICATLGKPLISAAITQWEGLISLYDPARGGPCYECVFPERPLPGMVPTCAEAGVAAPLPGILGAMMAMEAVKHITGAGEPLKGRLLIHDALYGETRVIGLKKRQGCPVCGLSEPVA